MTIKPVIIGNATLYHGDCLEIMPTLSPVDLVVADAPYLLETGGKFTGEMGGKFAKENYDNSGAIVDTPIEWHEFMKPIYNTMTEGHAYFMANNRHVLSALTEAEKAGFRFHNILVWDKGTATQNRWYMKNCEFTIFVFKGKAKKINNCSSNQLLRAPNVLNAKHPTQKPVPLMRHYITNSSQRGQTVLDPFMGSGTTGIAALQLGRKFIGIEKDKKYFELACRRMGGALDQGDMLY